VKMCTRDPPNTWEQDENDCDVAEEGVAWCAGNAGDVLRGVLALLQHHLLRLPARYVHN